LNEFSILIRLTALKCPPGFSSSLKMIPQRTDEDLAGPISREEFLLYFPRITRAHTLIVAASHSFYCSRTALAASTEDIEQICQNGSLVEERPVPGAYSSVCMDLLERIVPLPRLQERMKFSERSTGGVVVVKQRTGGSGKTGETVWNSGLLLTRFLDELSDRRRDFWSRQRVLELGAGAGLSSIAAYKLGAKQVLCTDGNPEVLELAQVNIERNCDNALSDRCSGIESKLLRWGMLNAMDYSEAATFVLGADLTYNPGSWRVLAETMVTVLTTEEDGYILYMSLGHEGFNVSAEMDGFLSVAREFGLISVPDLEGINASDLLNSLLTSTEWKVLEEKGGAKVAVLKRKSFQPRR
jgi:SAM-dependent methyltransferase